MHKLAQTGDLLQLALEPDERDDAVLEEGEVGDAKLGFAVSAELQEPGDVLLRRPVGNSSQERLR